MGLVMNMLMVWTLSLVAIAFVDFLTYQSFQLAYLRFLTQLEWLLPVMSGISGFLVGYKKSGLLDRAFDCGVNRALDCLCDRGTDEHDCVFGGDACPLFIKYSLGLLGKRHCGSSEIELKSLFRHRGRVD